MELFFSKATTNLLLIDNFECSALALETMKKLVSDIGIEASFGILNGLLEQRLMQTPAISMNSKMRHVSSCSGIYYIFYNDELVYIGSSDDVRGRMREHRRSILNAINLNIDDYSFRYLMCPKMAALSCEEHLIEFHKPSWNRSGFGSKNSALFSQSKWNQNNGRSLPLLDNSLRLRESHASLN